MTDLPEYVQKNRDLWDADAENWVESGKRNWAGEPDWGFWGIPESELSLLPVDMTGMRSIELGCGTAYVSAWMARRGATVVGIDNSARQLETARRLASKHGIDLELIHGNAERVPLPDAFFDFAISEYGAAIWADPYEWIPEAHRLLRTGCDLVFIGHHPLASIVQPRYGKATVDRELRYSYFDLHRIDWEEDGDEGTEFNLPVSKWMRLFDEVGFDILAFHELRHPSGGDEVAFDFSADWAHDFPAEQVWKLRKR
jgi:SAM-dependent methyltransferase